MEHCFYLKLFGFEKEFEIILTKNKNLIVKMVKKCCHV